MTPLATALDQLQSALPAGAVVTEGSPDYDTARRLVIASIDTRPGAVVTVSSPEEVVAVLDAVRGSGLEVAIRGGRHSGAALSTTEGGIVIDTRGLDTFELDAEAGTVWVGSGLTAGEVTARLSEHGLAVGFGDTGSVGVAGITLGGGVGFLSRKYGLTIDNVLAAELVTASGEVVLADETHHPDLFWALRGGGGGGLGVVTRLQLKVHALPEIYGGMLMLPATPQTLAGAVRVSAEAPRELTTIINVMPCPPMPFVPADQHGSLVVMVLLAYAGPAAEGEQVVAGLRSLATPLADMVQPMPYAGLFQAEGPEGDPNPRLRTFYLERVDEDLADLVLTRLRNHDASVRVVQIRALGGAIDDVDPDATAYAHRGLPFMANVANFVDAPEQAQARDQWAADFARDLDQGLGAQYVNFVGPEGDGEGREAYPETTRKRLLEVKRRYDPDNVFTRWYYGATVGD